MIAVPKFSAFAPLFDEYARVAAGPLEPRFARSLRRALERAEGQANTVAGMVTAKADELPDVAAGQELVASLREAATTARSLIDELPARKPKAAIDGSPYAARLSAVADAFRAADELVHAGRGIGVPQLPPAPAAARAGAVEGAARLSTEAAAARVGLDAEGARLLRLRPRLGEALQGVLGSRTLQRAMRVQVAGAEHIPKEGGVVIAATHTGAGDLVTTQFGHGRLPRIMAHHGLMRNPVAKFLLERGGAFPVEPGNSRVGRALMEGHLLQGNVVKIYSEGMLPRVDRLAPAREGAAMAAIRTKRPVVVQGEYGTRPARQYGESVREHWSHARGRGAIAYSEPIPTSHLDPDDPEHVLALAARIGDEQQRLRELARGMVAH